MHPYQPGKPIGAVKRELGLSHVVKMASNENPFGPSPKAIEALNAASSELNFYPDGASYDLRQALAERFCVPFEQVVVGNGSEEIIANLALAFIGSPDDQIVTSECSFPRYDAAAHLAGCRLIKVPLGEGWRYDLPAIARAVTERTKIVYIANPNNPTGTMVGRREIEGLLRDLPDTTLLALDEAYFEFARNQNPLLGGLGREAEGEGAGGGGNSDSNYPDGREYVLKDRNVVAIRTFSKLYGLAGIRIGYAFVPEYIAPAIERVRAPFDINSLAQAAGIAALSDDAFVEKTLANNRSGLQMLQKAFALLGCSVTESRTNFHFVDLGRPCEPVFQALLERGYIVRPCTGYGAPNHIRVSVGTPEENEGFVVAFREVVSLGQMAGKR